MPLWMPRVSTFIFQWLTCGRSGRDWLRVTRTSLKVCQCWKPTTCDPLPSQSCSARSNKSMLWIKSVTVHLNQPPACLRIWNPRALDKLVCTSISCHCVGRLINHAIGYHGLKWDIRFQVMILLLIRPYTFIHTYTFFTKVCKCMYQFIEYHGTSQFITVNSGFDGIWWSRKVLVTCIKSWYHCIWLFEQCMSTYFPGYIYI